MQDNKKKVFISDWELKRMAASGRKPVLPENAIVSPLSSDWLDYGGEGPRAGSRAGADASACRTPRGRRANGRDRDPRD